MATRSTSYSRTIREGPVRIVNGNQDSEKKHLKAVGGSNGVQSARLELYESANREGSVLQHVPFADVEYVSHKEMRHKEVITVGMQGNKTFSFYADSQQSTLKWYRYCSLLFKIPNYGIPEIPKEDFALQLPGISRYCEMHKCDTANKWVVTILNKEIRSNIGQCKVCVVEVCNSNGTFNIYGFYSGNKLLTWQRDKVKLSGCIESLVFVEVDKACYGEPTLLWMKCPVPQSVTLQKQIQEFSAACDEEPKTPSPTGYVFVDAATSNTHSKGDTDQLSQTPYEDQLSDNVLLPNTPISQSGASVSLNDSQCSSGYSSDNSCGGSVGLWSCPIGTCKVLPKIAEKEQGTHENFTTPPTQTVNDDKLINSSNSSPVNECLQNKPISSVKSCKSTIQTNPSTLHSQQQCKKHTSSTRETRIPKPSSGSTRMPGPVHFVPNGQTSPVTVSSSTVQEDELASENLSSLKQRNVTDATLEHQLERIAFQKCSVIISESLDISAILPHLNSSWLLTQKDCQMLLNRSITAVEKAEYLLEALPRKDSGFLKKFKDCLRRTQQGTGHGDILKALLKSYHDAAKEIPKAHLTFKK